MDKNIPKYSFRKELPQECEILDLEHLCSHRGKMLFKPHRTDFHHLFLFRKAEGRHTVDFKDFPLTDNSLLFIPKDSVHQFHREACICGKLLIFTDNFFYRNQHSYNLLTNCIVHSCVTQNLLLPLSTQNTVFYSLFEQIANELNREKDATQTDILGGYIHLLLLHLMREQASHPSFAGRQHCTEWELVLSFWNLLELHYTTNPSVYYFCQRLNVTEKRLQTATRNLLNRSPKQVIKDRLLLEAKRLLTYSSDSIKEIAFRLGFDEATNFTKFFKKNTGEVPLNFRSGQNG